MFENFFDVLAGVMNFFYTLVPNYGVAIMGLTVVVMVLITPLTVKSTRSMLQMQRLQPEMKRIQEKYKNDRETLNKELMAFYQENKINPLGGCLPLLFQMPVFIVMYQLLRGLTTRAGGAGTGVGHIAGQFAENLPFTPWVYTDQVFQPQHLNPSTELYQSLSTTNDMNFFGMDLALSAAEALRNSLLIALPYFALLGVMLATGIYQNRQLQARNSGANVNPQQQAIMKFMPFFLPVFSFGFPAGLALYWCTQNFCRIGTNAYITRSIYAKAHADGPIETTGKESTKKKGGADAPKAVEKADETGTGAKKATSKGSSGANGATPRSPGKSVRSQKAHEKGGQRRSGNSGKGGGGNRRKSGEGSSGRSSKN